MSKHKHHREHWRVFPLNRNYEVSTKGRIRRRKGGHCTHSGKVLSPGGSKYLSVTLYKRPDVRKRKGVHACKGHGYMVHEMVLLTFVGLKPKGCVINHKDFDTFNNKLRNLEYCTQKENIAHAIRHGHWPKTPYAKVHPEDFQGEKNPSAKLTKHQVNRIRKKYATKKYKQTELAKHYGVTPTTIWQVVHEVHWK